jgi:hypothetical protein
LCCQGQWDTFFKDFRTACLAIEGLVGEKGIEGGFPKGATKLCIGLAEHAMNIRFLVEAAAARIKQAPNQSVFKDIVSIGSSLSDFSKLSAGDCGDLPAVLLEIKAYLEKYVADGLAFAGSDLRRVGGACFEELRTSVTKAVSRLEEINQGLGCAGQSWKEGLEEKVRDEGDVDWSSPAIKDAVDAFQKGCYEDGIKKRMASVEEACPFLSLSGGSCVPVVGSVVASVFRCCLPCLPMLCVVVA